jgi:quercetin dioxygenase-like cupin family protein
MQSSITRTGAAASLISLLTAGALALAQEAKKPEAAGGSHAGHTALTPKDLQWTAGPGSIPAGAKMAMLQGDLKNPGLFALRLRLPADYKIPPHFHPADEQVTVLAGTLYMGLGDKFDTSKAAALPRGSFSVVPAKSNHFAFTKEETVVQVHAIGPWGITYVNPADDPRNQ